MASNTTPVLPWPLGRAACVVLAALVCLSGCQTARYRTVNREVLDDIQSSLEEVSSANGAAATGQPPEAVLQALVPGLTLNSAAQQEVEERFDFVVQQPMDAREFFSLLTEGTQYSVVVSPGVSGTIATLDLKNVTISEALDQVSALYGYQIKRSGNIFQVLPGGLQTRIFKVNYLNVNRNGNSNMRVVASGILNSGNGNNGLGGIGGINGGFGGGFGGGLGGGLGGLGGLGNNGLNGSGVGGIGGSAGGASITTTSESDYWEDLEDILRSIIGAGAAPASNASTEGGFLNNLSSSSAQPAEARSVIVSPQTGMVVVRAYPDELDQVAKFLNMSQDALQRQVILEAKILEVELKEGFQAGIDFSVLGKVNSNDTISATLGLANPDQGLSESIGNPLKLIYNGSPDFEGVLRLLETQGNVQVVSSPRISTLNNQKAVFKVGDEEYFATNANSTISTSDNRETSNSNANLQPFFSGIALDVTPQISEAGDIILHIHPLLNEVQENNKLIDGKAYPLANTTVRESDSIARARNGEVIIISGLMQTRARGQEAGVPAARDIPVIGNALEQKQVETVKTELVILLRAVVDEGSNMQSLIDDHTAGFDKLRRKIDPYYRQ